MSRAFVYAGMIFFAYLGHDPVKAAEIPFAVSIVAAAFMVCCEVAMSGHDIVKAIKEKN